MKVEEMKLVSAKEGWLDRSCGGMGYLQFTEWESTTNMKHKSGFWRDSFNALVLSLHFVTAPGYCLMDALLLIL